MFSKTVFSLVYPETEKVLAKLWKKRPLYLYQNSYLEKPIQTKLHLKFRDRWLKWTSRSISHNPELIKNFYPTAGSSEAIRESLALFKAQGGKKIHVFSGEYEGYRALAEAYDLKVIEFDRNQWKKIKLSPDDRFYISQPSSIDGNLWKEFPNFIKKMETSKAKVMLDVCYVGTTTKKIKVDTNSPAIHTLFFSLSKVFGVYFHRIGGVFSKEPIPGLEGNKWFKNLFSLLLGIKLMKKYKLNKLPKKYKKLQHKICHQNKIKPSDVIMLAFSDLTNEKAKDFKRTSNQARYCLTQKITEAL